MSFLLIFLFFCSFYSDFKNWTRIAISCSIIIPPDDARFLLFFFIKSNIWICCCYNWWPEVPSTSTVASGDEMYGHCGLVSQIMSSLAALCMCTTATSTSTCIMWCELNQKSKRPGNHFSGIRRAPMIPPKMATPSCFIPPIKISKYQNIKTSQYQNQFINAGMGQTWSN